MKEHFDITVKLYSDEGDLRVPNKDFYDEELIISNKSPKLKDLVEKAKSKLNGLASRIQVVVNYEYA